MDYSRTVLFVHYVTIDTHVFGQWAGGPLAGTAMVTQCIAKRIFYGILSQLGVSSFFFIRLFGNWL